MISMSFWFVMILLIFGVMSMAGVLIYDYRHLKKERKKFMLQVLTGFIFIPLACLGGASILGHLINWLTGWGVIFVSSCAAFSPFISFIILWKKYRGVDKALFILGCLFSFVMFLFMLVNLLVVINFQYHS